MTESVLRTEIEIPYSPYGNQVKFHQSTTKFRALITGVGFGKTAAGANELLKMAVEYPKSLHVIIAPNTKIMQAATLPEVFKFGEKLILDYKKSQNTLTLVNGAKILLMTADNDRQIDRLRGMNIGSFWADEAALFRPGVWDVLLARLRSEFGPLRGVITTTPKGMDWLYWYFVKGRNPRNKKKLKNASQYEWWGGTTLDNPFTPQEFKQTLLDTYTGLFKEQEIYGKFVGFEGQVYKNFNLDVHVLKKVKHFVDEYGQGIEHSKGKVYFKEMIFSVDWGFTNPMVGLIIGFDNDGRAYVVSEWYKRQEKVHVLIDWTMQQNIHWSNVLERGYGDPAEPQFISDFNGSGLNMAYANNQVLPGINTVYDMLEMREDGTAHLYVCEECENTIEEFSMYRFKEAKDGTPLQENPLKVNDHAMDALRYGLHSHNFGSDGFVLLDDPDGVI